MCHAGCILFACTCGAKPVCCPQGRLLQVSRVWLCLLLIQLGAGLLQEGLFICPICCLQDSHASPQLAYTVGTLHMALGRYTCNCAHPLKHTCMHSHSNIYKCVPLIHSQECAQLASGDIASLVRRRDESWHKACSYVHFSQECKERQDAVGETDATLTSLFDDTEVIKTLFSWHLITHNCTTDSS